MYKKKQEETKTVTDKKDWENKKPTLQPKWDIEADLNEEQLAEAFKMLEAGMKPRKVAFHFGFHRNKIKTIS